MTSFSDRLQLVEDSKSLRRRESRKYEGRVPTGYLVFSVALIPVVLSLGVVMGLGLDSSSEVSLSEEVVNGSTVYSVRNYSIVFVPEDQGRMNGSTVGFDFVEDNQRFYIEKGLTEQQLLDTCRHELMHDMGIGSKYHEFIYRNEDKVESRVCRRLLAEVS